VIGVEGRVDGDSRRERGAQDLLEQRRLARVVVEGKNVQARGELGHLQHPLAHRPELGAQHPFAPGQ
jgi:hypothetical protein